jgi:hypothetical protein
MWRRIDLVWPDVSEERRVTQDLHGATSHKTAFFIVTAVKTSNLTIIVGYINGIQFIGFGFSACDETRYVTHSKYMGESNRSFSNVPDFLLFHQYPICIPLLPNSCCMLCQPHPPWLGHSNYTWRRVQVMKPLITQFSLTSCCPWLLIQYICRYPPYLEAATSIRNPRTRHAVVTRDPRNMDGVTLNIKNYKHA